MFYFRPMIMNIWILIVITIIVMSIFWFNPFQLTMSNEIIFRGYFVPVFGLDGFTTSVSVVTLITPLLSVISCVLLSWADHKKSLLSNVPASALLGLIVIIPISGIAGPMLAVILGVVTGSCLFFFEFWRNRKI